MVQITEFTLQEAVDFIAGISVITLLIFFVCIGYGLAKLSHIMENMFLIEPGISGVILVLSFSLLAKFNQGGEMILLSYLDAAKVLFMLVVAVGLDVIFIREVVMRMFGKI